VERAREGCLGDGCSGEDGGSGDGEDGGGCVRLCVWF